MSKNQNYVVCPVCGERFDPNEAAGWCMNPKCGKFRLGMNEQSPGTDRANSRVGSENGATKTQTTEDTFPTHDGTPSSPHRLYATYDETLQSKPEQDSTDSKTMSKVAETKPWTESDDAVVTAFLEALTDGPSTISDISDETVSLAVDRVCSAARPTSTHTEPEYLIDTDDGLVRFFASNVPEKLVDYTEQLLNTLSPPTEDKDHDSETISTTILWRANRQYQWSIAESVARLAAVDDKVADTLTNRVTDTSYCEEALVNAIVRTAIIAPDKVADAIPYLRKAGANTSTPSQQKLAKIGLLSLAVHADDPKTVVGEFDSFADNILSGNSGSVDNAIALTLSGITPSNAAIRESFCKTFPPSQSLGAAYFIDALYPPNNTSVPNHDIKSVAAEIPGLVAPVVPKILSQGDISDETIVRLACSIAPYDPEAIYSAEMVLLDCLSSFPNDVDTLAAISHLATVSDEPQKYASTVLYSITQLSTTSDRGADQSCSNDRKRRIFGRYLATLADDLSTDAICTALRSLSDDSAETIVFDDNTQIM